MDLTDTTARAPPGGGGELPAIFAIWTVLLATYVIGGGHLQGSPDAPDRLLYAGLAYLLGVAVSCLYLPARGWVMHRVGRTSGVRLLSLSAALTLGHSALDTALEGAVFTSQPPWAATIAANFAFYSPVHLSAGALVMLMAHMEARQRSESRLARALAEQARAEASALRAQLQPHFLFNTLNGVAALVATARNHDAVALIAKLAELLRQTGRIDVDEPATVRSEVALARTYADIQATRFGDRFQIEWDVDPALHAYPAPALLLMPMLDEAVRCSAGGTGPIRVRVSIHEADGRLRIECAAPGARPEFAVVGDSRAVAMAGQAAGVERSNGPEGFRLSASLRSERHAGRASGP